MARNIGNLGFLSLSCLRLAVQATLSVVGVQPSWRHTIEWQVSVNFVYGRYSLDEDDKKRQCLI
jgi:hypothetical protein